MTIFCKQRLGWEDTQGSLLKESSWGGQEAVYAALLFSCARGQAACVHHFHHILHLSRALESLAAVVVGRDLASSVFCVSAWMLQQETRRASRLNVVCKTSLQSGKTEQKTQIKNKFAVKTDNFCVFFFCS